MPFDWNEYLTLAEELRKNNGEAHQRSAISRGYYSAFNLAKCYLRDKQRTINTDNHKQFWSHVRTVSGEIELQTMGQRVRLIRKYADYDCELPKLTDEVKTAMLYSAKIVYLISKLDRTPTPVLPGSGLPAQTSD